MTLRPTRTTGTWLLVAALLGAVVVVRGASPTVSPAGADPDEDVAPLEWAPCTDPHDVGLDCASPMVPLDHDDPFGPQIQLYVTRLPATGAPEDRIGSLFVNPGGPGGSTIGLLNALAPGFSPAIRQRFDIVSLNPRGVVGSAPQLTCEAGPWPDDAPDTMSLRTAEEWQAYYELTQPATVRDQNACQVASARIGRFLGTNQVVEDLDHLRAAVGDELLNYWGISYGSRIGTVYAQRHPDRVRAMVLDGVLAPELDWFTVTAERGASYDDALEVYLDTLPAAAAAFEEVARAALEDGPIPVVIDGEAGELDLHRVLSWAHDTVGRQGRWRWFEAQLLAVQAQLRGGPTAELVRVASSSFTEAVFEQVMCLDTVAEVTFAEAGRTAAEMVAEGPGLGWKMADGLMLCPGFPLPPDLIPTAPPAASLPPVLLVSSLHDPATPYPWAERAEAFIPGSRLLTYEGAQHGTWTRASSCIDAHVDAYWLQGDLPPVGTSCPLEVPPPTALATPTDVVPNP
jgi:pimeloyl-ACP methyl ester carboxylesterase